MPKIKLVAVSYFDHFSADGDEKECIAMATGIEGNPLHYNNDRYLQLVHIKADLDMPNSAFESHNILRSAIIKRTEFEIDLGDFMPIA